MATSHFASVCQAMANPDFYPHPVSQLERRETHISVVFLTGLWVYKLKKPVDFGFLDFRDLSSRRHYCEQEVRLNQRLSRDIYLGVVPVCLENTDSYRLGGYGEPVEYAVKMKQLPDETNLENLIVKRAVDPVRMRNLGHFLAQFYQGSEHGRHIDRYGNPSIISFNVEENFRQTEIFVDSWLDQEPWEFIRQVSRTYLKHHRNLLLQRMATGHVCDGHGDLRPGHVYFYRGIQVIDCIEFNDRFRYGDAAADLAFLHMDLDYMGALDWSLEFLASYVTRARDPDLYRLLDFYACYRAMVRVKVECLRSLQIRPTRIQPLQEKAAGYLFQAYRHAIQFSRPTLWVVCGLPATGKTTFARCLASHLDVRHVQSDRVRVRRIRIGDQPPTVAQFGKGPYRLHQRQQVYAELLAAAQDELKKGRSVLLDATFSLKKWRQEALRLAQDVDVSIVFLECYCHDETLQMRLAQREQAASLSDARLAHLPDFLKHYEPPIELAPDQWIRVNTEQPVEDALIAAMNAAYECLCRQIRQLL